MFGAKKKKNENEQGLVASAAGGNQTANPPGQQQKDIESASSYNDMVARQAQGQAEAQAQIDAANQQQATQFQAMSGDNPFGNEDPITGNLDTSMHGDTVTGNTSPGMATPGGGVDPNAFIPGATANVSYPEDAPSVGGTAINTGANEGISAQALDPMYYRDEFIDPLIKDNILQREAADFAGDTATHTASQVNILP